MFGTQNNYTKRCNVMSEAKNIGINPTNEPTSIEDIRNDRKQKLAATFRIVGKFGFDEGVAGHVTVRDPELLDHFWVNPFGVSFKQIKVSDLILVNHEWCHC